MSLNQLAHLDCRTLRRIALLSGPAVFAVLALALDRDANWDLRNYHIYVARALLNDRFRIDIAPAYHNSYHCPYLYVPYVWGLDLLGPRALAAALGAIQGCCVAVLYLLGELLMGRQRTAQGVLGLLVLAFVGATGAGCAVEVGTSFSDATLAGALLACLCWALRGPPVEIRHSRGSAWSFLVGLVPGAVLGLKLAFAPMICGFGAAVAVRWARRPSVVAGVALGGMSGLALAYGPWAAELDARFGNPFFPYFNDRFESPWGNRWSYRDLKFAAGAAMDVVVTALAPAYAPLKVGEVAFRDFRSLAGIAGTVATFGNLAIKKWRGRALSVAEVNSGAMAVFFCVALAVWSGMFGIYRYALALEMSGPILLCSLFVRPVGSNTARRVATALVVAALILGTKYAWWDRVPWTASDEAIEWPSIKRLDNALLVVTGRWPVGYLVGLLPPGVGMVRMEAHGDPLRNPTFPGPQPSPTLLGQEARRRIREHEGPIYLVTRTPSRAGAALHAHGLTRPRRCEHLETPFEEQRPLSVCEVRRFKDVQGTLQDTHSRVESESSR